VRVVIELHVREGTPTGTVYAQTLSTAIDEAIKNNEALNSLIDSSTIKVNTVSDTGFSVLSGEYIVTWRDGSTEKYTISREGTISSSSVANMKLRQSESSLYPASQGYVSWLNNGRTFYAKYSDGTTIMTLDNGESAPMTPITGEPVQHPYSTRRPVQEIRTKKPGRRIHYCPEGDVTSIWNVPRYRGIAIATDKHNLYLVNNKGRVIHHKVKLQPYLTRSGFAEPEGPLDAAVTTTLGTESEDKYQIFFKGDRYTLYKGFMRKHSGPHSIHDASGPLKVAFPRDVTNINAAMNLQSKDGKVYFFFRQNNIGMYYRYDAKTQTFDDEYPREVSRGFHGVPKSGPDAAVSSKRRGRTYFITDDKLYRMDDRYAKALSGYPRELGSELIRCVQPEHVVDGKIKMTPISFLSKLLFWRNTEMDDKVSMSEQGGDERQADRTVAFHK